MKRFGISLNKDHIKMFANGKEMNLDNEGDSYSYYYLKNSFGYRFKGFNFKGYMFSDNLEKNEINEIYTKGPNFWILFIYR